MTQLATARIREVLPYLAPSIREILERLPVPVAEGIEEIRLRLERPLAVRFNQEEYFLNMQGGITRTLSGAYRVAGGEISRTVQSISQGSLYAFEEEFRQGFLTLPGGHRVGLAGKAVLEKGGIKTLREIGSLNFRIARAVPGTARPILPYILDFRNNRPFHTLVVSPPCAGKTTLLRDIIRSLSYGVPELQFPALSVGVVDERCELAACYGGVPQHDLGPRVDVLDHCPKAAGMLMLLRSMGPQVIATDEIGRAGDVDAIWEMVYTGVSILATAHASSWEELEQRPHLQEVIKRKVFQRYVFLSRRKGPGTIEGVWDGRRSFVCGTRQREVIRE